MEKAELIIKDVKGVKDCILNISGLTTFANSNKQDTDVIIKYCFNNNDNFIIIRNPLIVNFINQQISDNFLKSNYFIKESLNSINKLKHDYSGDGFYFDDIYNELKEILGGELVEKDGEIYLRNVNSNDIEIHSASTFEQYLLLLQRLISNKIIGGFNFVVFHQPENGLHPDNQILFIELIAKLVSKGCNIIVTTNSPYILNAIEVYSKKYSVHSNYYLLDDNQIINCDKNSTELIYKTFVNAITILKDEESDLE